MKLPVLCIVILTLAYITTVINCNKIVKNRRKSMNKKLIQPVKKNNFLTKLQEISRKKGKKSKIAKNKNAKRNHLKKAFKKSQLGIVTEIDRKVNGSDLILQRLLIVDTKKQTDNKQSRQLSEENTINKKCGECVRRECPSVMAMRQYCPSGITRDECRCCPQCAGTIGMPCNLSNNSNRWLPPCGDDMECVPAWEESLTQSDGQIVSWGTKLQEGVCACLNKSPICGSNEVTYDDVCEFRLAFTRIPGESITISHKGPCRAAPKIDSPPEDTSGFPGGLVSFRCETSGFPLPRILWIKENPDGKDEELPGYLSHATTQIRGGPGKYQLTTWISLDKIKSSDNGIYICRSSNSYGTVNAMASLRIIEK